MKSPMIENAGYIKDKSGYSELQVLSSGAGYYVVTIWIERNEVGTIIFQEPGSRDSDYFKTKEQAEAYLKAVEGTSEDTAAIVLRNHP